MSGIDRFYFAETTSKSEDTLSRRKSEEAEKVCHKEKMEHHRPHLLNSKDQLKLKIDQTRSSSESTSGRDSTAKERVDSYSNLTVARRFQCAIILADINRKFSTQNFRPV